MTFGAALARLREAQKTSKGVSLYSRYVNRPLGRVLAAAACRAGLSAHHVTAASALCSGAGLAAVALAEPSWPLGLAVYAALVLGFALDSADGQLARLRGTAGPAGEWLDHIVDCAKVTALHAVVLISAYRFTDAPRGWLLVPLLFQLAALVIFCGGLLTDQLKRAASRAAPPAAPGPPPSRLRAAALLPVDYGVLCAVFLLLGSPAAFRAAYTALCAAYVLFCGAFLVKWFRELSAVSASSAARS
ncbi:CDP-alcohol phosphatidyltransferase family protein [Streptomyces sp. 7-21]|uniref:CDP-alcohol phosphatidyltransferase family protein n=1 Tax=Streptomyces sp. 7-21 TaxID=2802283 RepID=UPI001EFF9F1B|nr:CDP-alcohol phosphatidyltransferase family protein [Streptomyces sp. 7-21]